MNRKWTPLDDLLAGVALLVTAALWLAYMPGNF
jgi:hypothetical protein